MKLFLILLCVTTCLCQLNTPQQTQSLKQMRRLVESELYLSYMRTDEFLLRWLQDQEYDVNAASTKLLQAIKWRKENKIDQILDERNQFLETKTKYEISGQDNLGNPIVTVEFSNWDLRRIVLAGKLQELHRHLIKLMELAVVKSLEIRKTKPQATQWIMFANFQGFTLTKQGCLACIPVYLEFVSNYENYYTGSLRKIIILNTPRATDRIAGLVRNIMSVGTRKAFSIYSNNKAEWDFLDTIIPRDQLIVRFGGTKKENRN